MRHRVLTFFAACSLLLLFGVPQAIADAKKATDAHAERIAAVEGGLLPANAMAGDTGWRLDERMAHYGVPGIGIAVIHEGRVAWFKTYGLADRETGEAVSDTTLFQAGSISKPVAAAGALRLVQDGKLSLEAPVNDKLTSWQIPANEHTREAHVSLTHLLSHTGGLTVHGFPGYAVDAPVPSVVQILDGTPPANTGAIRVDKPPGEGYRYSGGGYTIMQQLLVDVSGTPFPRLLDRLVLAPAGMVDSTYLQPLPPPLLERAAAGILPNGTAVRGKRHTYPEMAAAGLWTTAQDLARFGVEIQRSWRGEGKVLSKDMAKALLTPVDGRAGRGFFLADRDGDVYFEHGGWDEGFCAQLTAHRDGGFGVAVMINSNHPALIEEVVRAVADVYEWPGYQRFAQQAVPAAARSRYPGRYRYHDDEVITIARDGDNLTMQYLGEEPQALIHVGDGRYVRRERATPITFAEQDGTVVFQFVLDGDGRQSHDRMKADETVPRELLYRGDRAGALTAYRALIAKETEDSVASERALNNQGLDLLGRGRHEPAIALLEINTALYPSSANTWDSLGLAYRETGDLEQAVHYYRKALAVDPAFPSALEALAELEKEREQQTKQDGS